MTLRSEQAIPLPESDYVRVKVHSCGICGSDMHAYHGHDERRQPPIVLGHEVVGWLEENNRKTRVAINPLMTCGDCSACSAGREHLCPNREMIGMRLPGGFAAEVVIKRDNLWSLPPELSFDLAVLAEPLACSIHAVRLAARHSEILLQDSVITILGGGAIGLLIAQVLIADGVQRLSIVEAHAGRRQVLKELLPEAEIFAPENAQPQQDMIFDAVGSGITRKVSSELVVSGGVILHIGLQNSEAGLDTRRMTLQEVCVLGCYCYGNQDFFEALDRLARGDIRGGAWLDYRALSAGAEAFNELHTGSDFMKIVLRL